MNERKIDIKKERKKERKKEGKKEWEETNPSNIRKHPYMDICNNAISVVP